MNVGPLYLLPIWSRLALRACLQQGILLNATIVAKDKNNKLKFIFSGSGTHVNLFAIYYALVAAISEGHYSGDLQV